LNLDNDNITDAGLAHLQKLTNLTGLYLYDTKVTDLGLTYLRRLSKLDALELSYTKVTDAGAKKLQEALPDCLILR